MFSEEKPAKVMLEGVFTYGQLAQMDSDRLIRIILKLQQENQYLKRELERFSLKPKNGAFKLDPRIEYSLRESLKLFE